MGSASPTLELLSLRSHEYPTHRQPVSYGLQRFHTASVERMSSQDRRTVVQDAFTGEGRLSRALQTNQLVSRMTATAEMLP